MYKKQNSGLIEAISHTAGQHNKGFVRPVLTEINVLNVSSRNLLIEMWKTILEMCWEKNFS